MWRKKKWIIITGVASALILLAGIIGGAAYAQSSATTATDEAAKTTLMARVATILGIDQQKVEDAFAQAQKEMRDEALTSRLKNLLEAGEITQAQADQYQQWWQSRPEVPEGLGLGGGGRFHGGMSFGANVTTASPAATTATN